MIYKTAFAFLFATLIPLQSFARDYHVEAIIFTNTIATDAEVVAWNEKAPRNIRAQNELETLYRQAVEATEARDEATLLEADQGQAISSESSQTPDGVIVDKDPIKTQIAFELVELLDIQDKLEESPNHEILQTLSWNQSEANYKNSPLINTLTPHMKGVIRVYAPNLLFAKINLTYVPDEIFEESLKEEQDISEEQFEAVVTPGFDTTYAAITFGDDFTTQPVVEPVITRYFMDEQRKLKLNEIHYFDHARFGVILSVKPIEEPAAEAS